MREMRNVYSIFWGGGNLKEGDYLEDLGVDGKVLGMDLTEIEWKGVDRIHLTHDRDQWWALVNTIMNLRVP
jgi:hypothetical protein